MDVHERLADPRPVVVVGAGLAGAATAAALARRGVPVTVLEAERVPGHHSSGRNAGLVRRAVEDPAIAALCRAGADAIAAREVPFRRTGSVLLDPEERIPSAVWRAIDHRPLTPEAARERCPVLRGTAARGAIETPDDGIVEVHALLTSYLDEVRTHGGTVRFGEPAVAPLLADSAVVGVRTAEREVRADHVVIATGAWGEEWGRRGGVPIDLVPLRRHLVLTADAAPPWDRPWVWHLAEGWYVRPEAAGLLWCACEEIEDRPGDAVADPDAPLRLAEKLADRVPAAGSFRPVGHWAGHRTFCPDRRFLLGPDPRLAGWHWAVGLGGHGVTTSAAVGECVARGVLEGAGAIDPRLALRPAVVPGATLASPQEPMRS